MLHDLDALHVEHGPDLIVLVEDIEGQPGGDVEQGSELGGAFRLVVDHLERLFRVMGDMLVKLVVLLVRDLRLVPQPEGLARIERLVLPELHGLRLVEGARLLSSPPP